jgi:hypothetical protein
MVKGAFLARRHPVNVARRDQIFRKLVADYQPQTTLLRSSCEMLAGILEQLEVIRPGLPEHQRLVQLSQQLGTTIEETRRQQLASLHASEQQHTVVRVIVDSWEAHLTEDQRASVNELRSLALARAAASGYRTPDSTG